MLELNHEMLKTFKCCPKKYWWRCIEKVDPLKNRWQMDKILFEAMARENSVAFVSDMIDNFIKYLPPEETEELTILKYILTGMLNNFPGRKEFERKLFRVEIFPNINLECAVYGYYFNNKYARMISTTSQTLEQFRERMMVSSAATEIIWSLRKTGCKVSGIIYDHIRKPALRKADNEDMHQFGSRIMLDYKMRPEFYYHQLYVTRSDEELEIFEDDLVYMAHEIEHKSGMPELFYRNTDSCYHLNTPCPYLSICHTKKPDPMMLNLYFKQTKQGDKNAT